MKKIKSNQLIVAPLYSTVRAVSSRKHSFFSTQYSSSSSTYFTLHNTVAGSIYDTSISLYNDFSISIQLPKR